MVTEPYPFVGANLPTIPPLVKLTDAGKQTGTGWKHTANIYEKGLPPELPFVTGECLISDLGKGFQAVSSIVLGTDAMPVRVWNLSGIKQWNGVPLAMVI